MTGVDCGNHHVLCQRRAINFSSRVKGFALRSHDSAAWAAQRIVARVITRRGSPRECRRAKEDYTKVVSAFQEAPLPRRRTSLELAGKHVPSPGQTPDAMTAFEAVRIDPRCHGSVSKLGDVYREQQQLSKRSRIPHSRSIEPEDRFVLARSPGSTYAGTEGRSAAVTALSDFLE
jgi:hypothetical protein